MLEAVAANGPRVSGLVLARGLVLVVILVDVAVLVLVDAGQHHARHGLLVDERRQRNGLVLVVVLEDELFLFGLVAARVADDGLRLVGQARRLVVEVELGGLVGLLALVVADHGGEHAGERVDLVRSQRQAGGQMRLVRTEHALKAEAQRVAAAVFGRRALQALRHLLDGLKVGPCPDRAAAQLDGLALGHDALADPALHVVERRGSRRVHELCAAGRITGFEHPSLQPPSSAGTTEGRLLDRGSSMPDGTELRVA